MQEAHVAHWCLLVPLFSDVQMAHCSVKAGVVSAGAAGLQMTPEKSKMAASIATIFTKTQPTPQHLA